MKNLAKLAFLAALIALAAYLGDHAPYAKHVCPGAPGHAEMLCDYGVLRG